MTSNIKHVLIYGGSFDPIHNGHLNTALAVEEYFKFEQFIFLPAKQSVLKEKHQSTSEQRLAMLKLALAPYPVFSIDTREIERDTPSYMVETLKSIRQEVGPQTALVLLMAIDTFLKLEQWYHWQQVLTLSHLLIVNRDELSLQHVPESLNDWVETHRTQDKEQILNTPAGKVYSFDAGCYPISSTAIRAQAKYITDLSQNVPSSVARYIKEHQLYL